MRHRGWLAIGGALAVTVGAAAQDAAAPVANAADAAARLEALAPVIVAAPGAEAQALALDVARGGTLAALLPIIAGKETEELVAAHPELTAADRERLRATAQTTYAAGRDRILAATAHEYARRLTLADLRQLAAIARAPASARLRAVLPVAILGTMQAVGGLDFKGDTLAAFCRETGKACARK